MKRCNGCGAVLQCDDSRVNGYIKKDKIDNGLYCERCFKIINYNEKIVTKLDNINDYIIKEVNRDNKFVFFLIDYLNICEEVIDTYKKIKCPKVFVISKLDIIPKNIKETKIKAKIKEIYNVMEDILFLSSKKNINTRIIFNKLEEYGYTSAYILGYTNSGKSTLINKLCSINNLDKTKITTSSIPNTTVDFINMDIDGVTIIDSPGFVFECSLYEQEDFDLIRRINPNKKIRPKTYQLKAGASVVIEDKIRIETSVNNSFTLYFSNDVKSNRIFKNNEMLLNLKSCQFDILDNVDLVVKGLGFINIKKACTLMIYSVNDNLLEIRESMFK